MVFSDFLRQLQRTSFADTYLGLALGFISFILVISIWKRSRRGDVGLLPAPPGAHWFWGHERDIFMHAAGQRFSEWFNTYGHVVRYKGAFLHPDILVVSDPRFLHHMLTENTYGYTKSPVFRPLVDRLLGHGIVWAEGEEHKRQRKLFNPAFSPAKIRDMAPTVFEAVARLRSALEDEIVKSGGEIKTNIMKWTAGTTLDVIGKVGFGHDFEQGRSQHAKDIHRAWKEQVNAGMEEAAFYAQIVLRTLPFLLYLPVEAIKKQGAIKAVLQRLAIEVISEKEEVLKSEKGKTLLGLMMKANSEGTVKLTTQDMIDHICTFVVVGHESPAAVMDMTLYELARNPDKQQRLREELIALGREPTYEDLTSPDKLPYLDAVVKEGLRVYPVGAYQDRVALRDDVVPLAHPITTPSGQVLTSLKIKAGQLIQIATISINRVNAVWKDGSTFRPERWIEPGGLAPREEMQAGWSNILTFSAGPRQCIGYRLAILENKCVVAALVRNFVLHHDGVAIESKFSATLQPRVVGREKEGSQLPLRITLVEN